MRAIDDNELVKLVYGSFKEKNGRHICPLRLNEGETAVSYRGIVLNKGCEVFYPKYGDSRLPNRAIIFPGEAGVSLTVHGSRPIKVQRPTVWSAAPQPRSNSLVGTRL